MRTIDEINIDQFCSELDYNIDYPDKAQEYLMLNKMNKDMRNAKFRRKEKKQYNDSDCEEDSWS